jgi:glycosyltransferase involved in cell wall biosynthesis
VLEAAGILNERKIFIKIVLIGTGAQADYLREKVIRERIPNVHIEDWMAKQELFTRLAKADGLLIHLSETKLTKIALPSKIQAYLTTGKPIVAAVPGEANALLKKAGVRFVCKPDNPKLLAELIEQFVKMEFAERNVYGQRGKDYYWDHLCFRKGFDQFLRTYHLMTTKSYFRS